MGCLGADWRLSDWRLRRSYCWRWAACKPRARHFLPVSEGLVLCRQRPATPPGYTRLRASGASAWRVLRVRGAWARQALWWTWN